MAKRRMHNEQMWYSQKFAQLDVWARLLMNALIDTADDQGRMPGDPTFVRSRCFPYDDIPVDQMEGHLEALEGNESIILYEIDGQCYLQLKNWWKWQEPQWASPSKLPPPPGWKDRIRHRLAGRVLTYNWTTRSGRCLSDTCDGEGRSLVMFQGEGLPRVLAKAIGKTSPETQGQEHDYEHGKQDSTTTTGGAGEKNELDGIAVLEGDELAGEVYRLAEQWLGRELTPTQGELLFAALDEASVLGLSLEDWRYAFQEAAAANAREFRYVEAILRRIAEERQAEAAEQATGPPGDKTMDPDAKVWRQVLEELQGQLTAATFASWVGTTTAQQVDGRWVVWCVNPYAVEWLENRLKTTIQRTLVGVLGEPAEVEFRVREPAVING